MSSILDFYLVKAVKDGLVDIDKKYLVLTDNGNKVFDEIAIVCFKMLDESNDTKDFVTGAAKNLGDSMGIVYNPM